jgi:hypothetical protein
MLWLNDYCRYLAASGQVGQPLRFVWGGHSRPAQFSHYNVAKRSFMSSPA